MSYTTRIQWATATFNPWIGCTKVSAGCANCYAEARDQRFSGGAHWGKGKPRQRTSAATWRNPVKWNADTERLRNQVNFRPRVFPSLCDWLDEEVPVKWLVDFLDLIRRTPHLDWLLLTKRPEQFNSRIMYAANETWNEANEWIAKWLHGDPPKNVWVGASVENQDTANKRVPELVSIPAAIRFLSAEPLLGNIDLGKAHPCGYYCDDHPDGPGHMDHEFMSQVNTRIKWVIVGGESGPGARPCDIEWIANVVIQCSQAKVPCFVKQLGSRPLVDEATPDGWPPGTRLRKWLGYTSGRRVVELDDRKGGDPMEWPADLRVREFPS